MNHCGYEGSDLSTDREITKDWISVWELSLVRTLNGVEGNESQCGMRKLLPWNDYSTWIYSSPLLFPTLFLVLCSEISLTPGNLNTFFLKKEEFAG